MVLLLVAVQEGVGLVEGQRGRTRGVGERVLGGLWVVLIGFVVMLV